MADSLLNTVKQGSQLYKESSEAVSSLGAKSQSAGLQKAPSTPLEAAVVGGTPSQSKMAATPAGMQGQAKQIKLPPSLQLATQQRRQQVDPRITAEQARADEIAQKLSGLGSLGQRVPALITQAQQTQLQGVQVTPQVDQTQLATLNLSSQDQTTLTDNLNLLKDPAQAAKHPEALVKVSQLTGKDLGKMNPTTLAATVSGFFKKDAATNLGAAVEAASPATVSLGMIGETPTALGYDTWDSLADDLGIKVSEGQSAADSLKKMTVKELGQVVDTMKRTGYSTQQEWMSVLQNPTSSMQDRQVARTMLTNMGASGVREAEQKTQVLVDQVQAGNTVTVNLTGTPQRMSVEDVLKSDAVLGAVSVLLNPESPGYKEVAAANPQLLAWVQKNAAALQDQVKGISNEVSQFATQNAANAKVLDTISFDDKTKDVIGKVLFPDTWGSVSSKKYDLTSSPLLQNWAQIPEGEQTQIKSAIQTIADGGTSEDITAFLNTNRDALKNLKLDTVAGVQQFQGFWSEQKLIRSLGASGATTNLANPESFLFDITGESSQKLAQDAATQSALAAIGFKPSSGLTLPADLKTATGLAAKPSTMASILSSGKLPVSLKDQVKGVNKEMGLFATSGDTETKAVASAILEKHGPLKNTEINQVVTSAGIVDDISSLRKLESMVGGNLTWAIRPAALKQVGAKLTESGLPTLMSIVNEANKSPDKTQGYLDKLRGVLSSVDRAAQPDVQKEITRLEKLKKYQEDERIRNSPDEKRKQFEAELRKKEQEKRDKEAAEKARQGSIIFR